MKKISILLTALIAIVLFTSCGPENQLAASSDDSEGKAFKVFQQGDITKYRITPLQLADSVQFYCGASVRIAEKNSSAKEVTVPNGRITVNKQNTSSSGTIDYRQLGKVIDIDYNNDPQYAGWIDYLLISFDPERPLFTLRFARNPTTGYFYLDKEYNKNLYSIVPSGDCPLLIELPASKTSGKDQNQRAKGYRVGSGANPEPKNDPNNTPDPNDTPGPQRSN